MEYRDTLATTKTSPMMTRDRAQCLMMWFGYGAGFIAWHLATH